MSFFTYWLFSGLFLYIILYNSPATENENKEFYEHPFTYMFVCLLMGGFAIPYMAISSLLES
jgi:hypothetical protein